MTPARFICHLIFITAWRGLSLKRPFSLLGLTALSFWLVMHKWLRLFGHNWFKANSRDPPNTGLTIISPQWLQIFFQMVWLITRARKPLNTVSKRSKIWGVWCWWLSCVAESVCALGFQYNDLILFPAYKRKRAHECHKEKRHLQILMAAARLICPGGKWKGTRLWEDVQYVVQSEYAGLILTTSCICPLNVCAAD